MMETRAGTATCRCRALAVRLLVLGRFPEGPQKKSGEKKTQVKKERQNNSKFGGLTAGFVY